MNCYICNKTYKNRKVVVAHIKSKHPDESVVKLKPGPKSNGQTYYEKQMQNSVKVYKEKMSRNVFLFSNRWSLFLEKCIDDCAKVVLFEQIKDKRGLIEPRKIQIPPNYILPQKNCRVSRMKNLIIARNELYNLSLDNLSLDNLSLDNLSLDNPPLVDFDKECSDILEEMMKV